MKNKIAERAKKKRRAQKETERRKQCDEIMEKFKAAAKKQGLRTKYSKESVWRAFNTMDRELVALSIVYCMTAVAYCLRKSCGWGQTRLVQYMQAVHKYIGVVGQQSRDIPALSEELKIDAGCDCASLFEGYEPFKGKDVGIKRLSEGQVIFQKIEYVFPMMLYTLYYDYGWKEKRMNRLCQAFKETIIDIIENDAIDNIKKTIYKECKIRICDNGTIYISDKCSKKYDTEI